MSGEMRKYTVLYTSSFASLHGGGQRSLLLILKHLDRARFDAVLTVPEPGELADAARKLGVTVVVLSYARLKSLHLGAILRTVRAFYRVCRDYDIDIIHTDAPRETLYAVIVRLLIPVRVIMHVRVSDAAYVLDHILYNVSDRLIAVSQAVTRRFPRKAGDSKIQVVYNAVDTQEFCPTAVRARDKVLRVGYVGRLVRSKGIEVVIKAIARISDIAHLTIIGDGDRAYATELKTLAAQLPVDFMPYQSDIRRAMSVLDVLVVPSLSGEGLSRVIIEGMAMGKVVIVSDVPPNREALGDELEDFIFKPGDDQSLADLLKKNHEQRHRAEVFRAHAQQRVHTLFNAAHNTRQIENIYTACAAAAPLPRVRRGSRSVAFKKLLRVVRRRGYQVFDGCGNGVFALGRGMRILRRAVPLDRLTVHKILLIRRDRVGDLVLSTPAIRAMRTAYPQAVIDILVSPYARDIVINNPHLNHVFTDRAAVRDAGYDLAVALHAGTEQNYIAWRSGACWRVGFTGWGGGFFLTHRLPDDRMTRPRHEVQTTLEAAAMAGADTPDRRLEVSLTEEGEAFAASFVRDHALSGLIIAVHPGARQASIRWQSQGFAAVCDRLIETYKATIILTGSVEEQALLDAVRAQMRHAPLICCGLRLTALISLLKRCTLYVGNVTGPMHIAAGLNLPVVAVTGMRGSLDDVRYWGPWCDHYEIVRGDAGCAQCDPGDCATMACMEKITVDQVYTAVERMVKKYGTY